MSGGAPIYGLIGGRLTHSLSVPLHRALGNETYRLIELKPDELEPFLRRPELCGVNVTLPYKRTVLPYLDELTKEAAMIGSVNTILRRNGRLIGCNTDAYGLDYLLQRTGLTLSKRDTRIFGTGGAARTAAYLARRQGAGRVTLVSHAQLAAGLAADDTAEILLNATPLGMYPETEGLPADPTAFPRCTAVIDLVYNPLRTRFLQAAEAAGLPCANGLGMLAAQAKAAHELFFDCSLPETENERLYRLLLQRQTDIVLIGMGGAGKSTIGRLLAQRSGREFFDTDELIASEAGQSIPALFAAEGEAGFRIREKALLRHLMTGGGRVIATGGGAVLDAENRLLLKQNARVYHIERDTELLCVEGRPLYAGADLAALYRARLPFYRQCRDQSIINNATPLAAAEAIGRDMDAYLGA